MNIEVINVFKHRKINRSEFVKNENEKKWAAGLHFLKFSLQN